MFPSQVPVSLEGGHGEDVVEHLLVLDQFVGCVGRVYFLWLEFLWPRPPDPDFLHVNQNSRF